MCVCAVSGWDSVRRPGLGWTPRAYPEVPRVSSLGAAHVTSLPRDMLDGPFVHRGHGVGCEQWWVVVANGMVLDRPAASVAQLPKDAVTYVSDGSKWCSTERGGAYDLRAGVCSAALCGNRQWNHLLVYSSLHCPSVECIPLLS